MTLNQWMIMEIYPNLKEKVGSLIPGYEISSLLDRKTCQVVNYLLCFGVGLSTITLFILLVPHNIVMNMNNVMALCPKINK